MDDFDKMAMESYDALLQEEERLKTKLAEIKERVKSLKAYLQSAGLIEKKT